MTPTGGRRTALVSAADMLAYGAAATVSLQAEAAGTLESRAAVSAVQVAQSRQLVAASQQRWARSRQAMTDPLPQAVVLALMDLDPDGRQITPSVQHAEQARSAAMEAVAQQTETCAALSAYAVAIEAAELVVRAAERAAAYELDLVSLVSMTDAAGMPLAGADTPTGRRG